MIRRLVLGAMLLVAFVTSLSAQWVVFDPSNFANAVEQLFKVKVASVKTLSFYGKERRRGRYAGYKPDWKKAYVKLKPGEKMIEYAENA
jgi:hypothetical protein